MANTFARAKRQQMVFDSSLYIGDRHVYNRVLIKRKEN